MPYNEPNITIIPLNTIEKLDKTTYGFSVVVEHSQKYHTFILKDMERTHQITEKLRKNAKDYLMYDIPYS